MLTPTEIFGSAVTADEISSIESNDGLTHPLLYLLYDENELFESNGYNRWTQVNTKNAFDSISQRVPAFIQKKKEVLLSSNKANASAALGEIRCYGILLDVFYDYKISYIKESKEKKSPDFEIEINGSPVYIEVATLQMNENEAKGLSEHHKKPPEFDVHGISISEHYCCPFGRKKSSGATPSVIYKLCSVKQNQEQLNDEYASVVWIDCQDEHMNAISDRLCMTGAIFSGAYACVCANGFRSNEIWYSLYAKKNMPIFNGETLNCREGNKTKLSHMKIDGRFIGNNLSAVIFNGPNALTLYENPYAKIPLPFEFTEKLSCYYRFRYESSRTNYPDNNLQAKIDMDYELIENLGNKNFYFM